MKMIVILILSLFTSVLTAPPYPVCYIAGPEMICKGFQHYADDLGFRETGNSPDTINVIGCFAEHQWKQSTLSHLGYNITLEAFRKDPAVFPREMQLEALKTFTGINRKSLEPYQCYVGTTINDVLITQSGLLAACHLGGIKSVKKYLLSQGKYILINGYLLEIKHSQKQTKFNGTDKFGTSVRDYIKEFAGYKI